MGFVKSAAKKSLLALTKKGELTPRFWARFFEAFVTKDELISFADSGAVDHGLLDGLTDDDHSIYYNAARHTALSHSFVDHDDLTNAGTNTHSQIDTHIGTGSIHFTEGSIDHGSITGLGDDDHSLYLLASDATSRASFATNWFDLTDGGDTILHIHDTRYYTKTETISITSIFADGTSAPVTVNLPEASTVTGYVYNIKAINVDNAVTVSTFGVEQIDGSVTDIVLALMEVITIQSDGSNWWII